MVDVVCYNSYKTLSGQVDPWYPCQDIQRSFGELGIFNKKSISQILSFAWRGISHTTSL
jgi:hypothetical protein